MISDRDKFIFVHIPKCGGTSIERFILSNYGVSNDWTSKYPLSALPMKIKSEFSIGFRHKQHMSLNDFPLEKQEEYFSFAFVRNPWDRIMSSYFYYKGLGCKFTFKSFLESNKSRIHCKPQFCFLNKNIDFIGRFENLQEDFNLICQKLGFESKKLPHENKTNHEHYTEWYTDENKNLVTDRYFDDIEAFDYEFGY
tara:strand:- start:1594 stop:2181 length:588 start_codon:yes stop_codon:yes gene_type:complete